MKKYICLLLYTSIFYAGEKSMMTLLQESFSDIHVDSMDIDETGIYFKSLSDTIDFNTPQSPLPVKCKKGKKILGVATFQYSKPDKNFIIQSKDFKNDKVQLLMRLLKDDFNVLQMCYNFNDEEENDFNKLEMIDLQETSLNLDHEKKNIYIKRLESNSSGLCLSKANFLNLIDEWKTCLNSKYPYLLLIQSLDNEYEIQPFNAKEDVDEYLQAHPIQK